MPKDMRTWINQLEEAGELLHLKRPVSPLTEMGALMYECRDKALLFERLTGFPGWRGIGQAPATPRQAAIAFDTTLDQVVPTFAGKLNQRVAPEMVATGPVKEVILKGEDVDVRKLPAHKAGVKDAAPFITAGMCITKDPDTGIRNMSIHRLQIKERNRTGFLGIVGRHTYLNYRKYELKNEPMPIAVCIGHHPLYYFAATTTGPYEMDEIELAGALLGEPVPLVKCETIDLEVPAYAEIILEGHVLPHYRESEGPFSEFQDYYIAGTGQNPVLEFTAMTMRKDAIYKNLQNGAEVEGCVYHKLPMAATIYNRLKNIGGMALVKNVMTLPGIFGVVVQMTPRFYGEAKTVLLSVLSSEYLHPKIAIAVDEDVDIFNNTDIIWAVNTRVNPEEDIMVIPGMRIIPMDPTGKEYGVSSTPEWHRIGGKMIIDATKPPTCNAQGREQFERIRPIGKGEVFLKDYLEWNDA
ncbi:MAG: UbiD family decarboxylase [Chloroflexi bacterium]|nr:UbiD family decarboxylase [Chloroflexota bacterium]